MSDSELSTDIDFIPKEYKKKNMIVLIQRI